MNLLVIDTNVFVSGLLMPLSTTGQLITHAMRHETLLFSDETFRELAEVLTRPKFDHYLDLGHRRSFIDVMAGLAEPVVILRSVKACRDPADDKFLDVAVNGGAAFILTGDSDLLALHPFQKIAILTPAQYLQEWGLEEE